MAHIFISYARPDEPLAVMIADRLRAAGFEIWRDDQLPAHRPYAEVIEERINGAAAVVVLWSAEAAKSQWVRAEADIARNARTLVQASVDGTLPPMPFGQIQCADLKDWDGQGSSSGWNKLADSVAELAGSVQPAGEVERTRARDLSICVLPFQNMSGDAEQEYFSDGISEDITTDLSKVSALEVIARNTAFTFKGQSVNVREVARKLGVSHVLEGSVRKAGNQVRITAQLVNGKTGGHLWADRFDRDLTDIFSIQDEISKAIVFALRLKLLPEEKKAIEQRGTASAEAYNLYLLARQYWVTGNIGDLRREERVMRICGRAVEIDPYYAAAWTLLAMAQSNLKYVFRCQVDDGYAAAHAALTIDPQIAEAHLPTVRRLEDRRRLSEADAEMETALRLDPDSWEVNKEAARVAMRQRRWEAAVAHLEKAVEQMGSDGHAWGRLVSLHHALKNPAAEKVAAERTVAEAEKVVAQDPSNGAAMSFGAIGCAALGQSGRAQEWIERALLVDPDNLSMRYNFACALGTYLGEVDGALKHLERSLESSGAFHLGLIEVDPDLDPLRETPRFKMMIEKTKKRLGIEDASEH
ncbi:MAG TPA: TIR domain-containing protein [Caulobacteraceae bacterium]|nr:TIR domain-containing protein [Caulobacteraceae bacterium]